MVAYETEVMELGMWRSYMELEESITLEELFALYEHILDRRLEQFKNMARAQGVKFDDDEGDQEAFNDVLNKVKEMKGEKPDNTRTLGLATIEQV